MTSPSNIDDNTQVHYSYQELRSGWLLLYLLAIVVMISKFKPYRYPAKRVAADDSQIHSFTHMDSENIIFYFLPKSHLSRQTIHFQKKLRIVMLLQPASSSSTSMVGRADGIVVGRREGMDDLVGGCDGRKDGMVEVDGVDDGRRDGALDGRKEGFDVGPADGFWDGFADGFADGNALGLRLGNLDGTLLGMDVGILLGCIDGITDGNALGLRLGNFDGT
jgi:hypothetical protein